MKIMDVLLGKGFGLGSSGRFSINPKRKAAEKKDLF